MAKVKRKKIHADHYNRARTEAVEFFSEEQLQPELNLARCGVGLGDQTGPRTERRA